MQLQVQVSAPGNDSPLVSDLVQGYQCPTGSYDEAFSAPGVPRAQWRSFLTDLVSRGAEEIGARWENGQTILRDHGVTYNTDDGNEDVERPWSLDLVPFIIDPVEWETIERGIVQRTRLLNRVLDDTYVGRQMLIRDGLLPPALIFANPSFLRPCRGIGNSGRPCLSLHSIDLVRGGDGGWRVLGDRTQALNGIGYALENRTVTGRILPEFFRSQNIRRLNQFFANLRDSLQDLGPSHRENPRIVLLSPGTKYEAYYEHTMMARYLGITLVEGGDLTVRNREVYLKTLEGLQRVDVVLRRVDDVYCDPLELRSDSFLGIAGLTESLRSGNVTIANSLGASLAESPALLPFLPRLCQHYSQEDLILPSGQSWWCGDAEAMNHVLANLKTLLVRPAFPPATRDYNCPEMDPQELEKLAAEIRHSPHSFIAQSPTLLSHAPAWEDGKLVPRPIVLRVFVASFGDQYLVMPGGLTRIPASATSPGLNLQLSDGSKDTWISAGFGQEPSSYPAMTLETRQTGRTSGGVPSRTADNLYWLGRYSERLEHTVRVLRTTLSRIINEPTQRNLAELSTLSSVLDELFVAGESDTDDESSRELEDTVMTAIYSKGVMGGIVELIDRIDDIASQARDRFSGDTRRILNKLNELPGERPTQIPATAAYALTHDLIADLAALSGMEMENMTRGFDWRFLDFGRRIERATNLSDLIRCALSAAKDPAAALYVLLEVADSTMTYRRTNYSQPTVFSVLELLILNTRNPRSMRFQVNRMIEHIDGLPGEESPPNEVTERSELTSLSETVLTEEIVRKLSSWIESGSWNDVALWFTNTNIALSNVSDKLTQRYFDLTLS